MTTDNLGIILVTMRQTDKIKTYELTGDILTPINREAHGECPCIRCQASKRRWQVGKHFDAISFQIKHFETEEVHAQITLYDNRVFHSILKHLIKRRGKI